MSHRVPARADPAPRLDVAVRCPDAMTRQRQLLQSPAGAGMDPGMTLDFPSGSRIPRARGDRVAMSRRAREPGHLAGLAAVVRPACE